MTESNISEGWRETKPSIGMGRMLSSDPQGRRPSGRTAIQPLRQPFNSSRRPEPRPLPANPFLQGPFSLVGSSVSAKFVLARGLPTLSFISSRGFFLI